MMFGETRFSLIWSQFQFLVTIDYFLGKKHIESMLYASTQPEGELLSITDTVHEPRNTYMYNQTTSVELSHILHVVQNFNGIGSLTH